ncbi:MAG: hypothetical protein EA401_13935 [Planctomycetota bacterium]|nr:MAG: hypothetical protein EA401_13935 [Planctomycetota bacterium]
MPPSPGNDQDLFDRFCQQLPSESADEYLKAALHSWALGRPESLTEALSRLARGPGRGRSRRARELDDELGLCGVWG